MNDTIRKDLEEISKFLLNVSQQTPSESVYDSWQRSLQAAIAKFSAAVPPFCPRCKGTEFKHQHEEVAGVAGTHVDGTERFFCYGCGYSIYAHEGKDLGFKFSLDR